MKLIPDDLAAVMLANGATNNPGEPVPGKEETEQVDFVPVVKLFVPWGAGTWLLTELNPQDPDIAFGLCDLGMGSPELGYVSLSELASVCGPGGLKVERDWTFKPTMTLAEYADSARVMGRIVT